MAFGYVIAQIDVTDPDRYHGYVDMVEPTIEAFSGEFLVRGGRAEVYEGKAPGARNVVIRFPSFEAARSWYHSEAYAEAKAIRMAASSSVQTIVEGVS